MLRRRSKVPCPHVLMSWCPAPLGQARTSYLMYFSLSDLCPRPSSSTTRPGSYKLNWLQSSTRLPASSPSYPSWSLYPFWIKIYSWPQLSVVDDIRARCEGTWLTSLWIALISRDPQQNSDTRQIFIISFLFIRIIITFEFLKEISSQLLE